MRTPMDAQRSLKRYVSVALGPDWEVRLSGEKGVFQRPSAVVAMVPSLQLISESWINARLQASFQIVAYPMPGASAQDSQANALAVADVFWTAFAGQGYGFGHPARVPLYDYADVPLTGPDAFAPETARNGSDYMKLEGPAEVTPTMNPDEELLWSVPANIRMSWMRSAAVPSTAKTTEAVLEEADETNG